MLPLSQSGSFEQHRHKRTQYDVYPPYNLHIYTRREKERKRQTEFIFIKHNQPYRQMTNEKEIYANEIVYDAFHIQMLNTATVTTTNNEHGSKKQKFRTRAESDPHCSNEHQTNGATTKRYEQKTKQKHQAEKKHAPTIQFT